MGWVGLGPNFPLGLGWVSQLMDWLGSGHTKWTNGQLWEWWDDRRISASRRNRCVRIRETGMRLLKREATLTQPKTDFLHQRWCKKICFWFLLKQRYNVKSWHSLWSVTHFFKIKQTLARKNILSAKWRVWRQVIFRAVDEADLCRLLSTR